MKGLAFVGDIHGSIDALEGILDVLASHNLRRIVFLGDYINKGPDSRAVLERLLELDPSCVSVLRGNHEDGMLKALQDHDLSSFLKMGGAATVRSYIAGDADADVAAQFLAAVPEVHLNFLRSMPLEFRSRGIVARHHPLRTLDLNYRVSAHRPVGSRPRVGPRSAHIDTGCGDDEGRLTAFLWPSRRFEQVDMSGNRVSPRS
ncbi:metallophosphoesterase [Microbacterium sp. ARD31]|uniref:metallophosphoesterase n=1 Tax=Microbacterium sp. ARD31 TaxID=2962576 RepID=UPI0037C888D6